jgi:gliding motility-associated-like protein
MKAHLLPLLLIIEFIFLSTQIVWGQNQLKELSFTENKGQLADSDGNLRSDLLYKAKLNGMDVYLSGNKVHYVLKKSETTTINEIQASESISTVFPSEITESLSTYRISFELIDANPNVSIRAEEPLNEYENYYLAHCPQGILNVKSYKKIIYENIYTNIDMVFYAPETVSQGGIKYDFIIHPGGNPADIKIKYSQPIDELLNEGVPELTIRTPFGDFKESMPEIFQSPTTNSAISLGNSRNVKGSYLLEGNIISFSIPDHDPSKTLVIDPWATYYGGSSGEQFYDIATDGNNNVVVTGNTSSGNFPTTPGTAQPSAGGGGDAFIVKIDALGNPIWATYYGGNSGDYGRALTIDALNNSIVTGYTFSTNFPVGATAGNFIFQPVFAGVGLANAFILKLNPNGLLEWATYYGGVGGFGGSVGHGIAVDNLTNNIFITGETRNTDFPTILACQATAPGGYYDAFLLKFAPNGNRLWATYLGGSGTDIAEDVAVDLLGNAIVVGRTNSTNFPGTTGMLQPTSNGFEDGFIAKYDNNNMSCNLLWASYLGGSSSDNIYSVSADSYGNILLTGNTNSTNFPIIVPALQPTKGTGSDAFVSKLNSLGTVLLWSTFYGGSAQDFGRSITADAADNAVVTGHGSSTDLIITVGAMQPNNAGGNDLFLLKLDKTTGDTLCATYLGGSGNDVTGGIAVDNNGFINLCGTTGSNDFPVNGNVFQTALSGSSDGFVGQFCPSCGGGAEFTFNAIEDTLCLANVDSALLKAVVIDTAFYGAFQPYLDFDWSTGRTVSNQLEDSTVVYPVMTMRYYLTLSFSGSCEVLDSIDVVVYDLPDYDLFGPEELCFSDGDSVIYVNNNDPGDSLAFNWSTSSTADSIIVSPPSAGSSDKYYVTITNGTCAQIDSFTVVCATVICEGDFTYTGTPYCQTDPDPTPTFIGGGIAGTFTASPAGLVFVNTGTGEVDLTGSSPDTYTVTNTIAATLDCPQIIETSAISITTPPVATFNYTATPYCQDDSNPLPVFSGGGVAGTFSSSAGLVFINTGTGEVDLSASTAGSYSVNNTIAAAGGCPQVAASSPIEIIAGDNAVLTYSSSVFCKTAGSDPDPTVTGTGGGTYSATPAGLVINAGSGTIDLALSSPGSYVITYTTPGTCPVSATFNSSIINAPIAIFNYSAASFCENEMNPTPILGAGASAGTFSSSPAGLVFVNTNTGEINLNASAPGTYTLTNFIAAAGGCAEVTESNTVNIYNSPVVLLSPATVCFGNSAILTASGATTYTWSPGTGLSQTNGNPVTANPTVTTIYTVVGTEATTACTDTTTVTLTVLPKPEASFSWEPQFLTLENPMANFTAVSSSGATSWQWDFAGLDSAFTANPSFTFPDVGSYDITLFVDNGICSNQTQSTIIVRSEFAFYVPNAFTPDDGKFNGVFVPVGADLDHLQQYNMIIFNRWGEIIFTTSSPSEGWNGMKNNRGEVLQQGTYIYKIDLIDDKGERFSFMGHVSLIK